nr:MAG TPA: hypothetical protein [Caudoviricetes sp.]
MAQSAVLMMNCRLKFQKLGNGYASVLFSSIIQVKHLMHQIETVKN